MKKTILILAAGIIVVGGGYFAFTRQAAAPSDSFRNSEENAPVEAASALLLRPDGLGVVSFGAQPEAVIAAVTERRGAPTEDTGPTASFSVYGTCPGEMIRVVEWGRLRVFFGDTAFGKGAFFHYEYTNRDQGGMPPLGTDKGISVGSSEADLRKAYPEVIIEPLMDYAEMFTIEDTAATRARLSGTLDKGVVSWISGGIECGE